MQVLESEVPAVWCDQRQRLKPRLYQFMRPWKSPLSKDAQSRLAIIGRYVLRREIFAILQVFDPVAAANPATHGLAQLVCERKIFGCEFLGDRSDIGDNFRLIRATVAYA